MIRTEPRGNSGGYFDILYQFNDAYAPYAGVSLTSLFQNNGHLEKLRVIVLGEGLSEQNIARLKGTAERYGRELLFLDCALVIEKMQNIGLPSYRGSYAANLRLFIDKIVPAEAAERILYIDSDTIVEGRLDGLIGLDMQEYPAAMVLDSLGADYKRVIGLSGKYYNSGMILFDLDNWRKGHYSDKILEHIANVRSHYSMPDQDLLNLVCNGHIMTVGAQYNYQPIHQVASVGLYRFFFGLKEYYSEEELRMAAKDPVIIHFFRFCGEFPWHEDNVHPDREIYERYRAKSLWKDDENIPIKRSVLFWIERGLYRYAPKAVFLLAFKVAHKMMMHRANKASTKGRIHKGF